MENIAVNPNTTNTSKRPEFICGNHVCSVWGKEHQKFNKRNHFTSVCNSKPRVNQIEGDIKI